MRDDQLLTYTEEGFKEFAAALTEYPEEMREAMASMVCFIMGL